jgi:hypothetical protein
MILLFLNLSGHEEARKAAKAQRKNIQPQLLFFFLGPFASETSDFARNKPTPPGTKKPHFLCAALSAIFLCG